MTKNLLIIIGLAVTFLGFQNCSSHHEGETSSSSGPMLVDLGALESAATNILSNKCATCHNPNSTVTSPIANILDIDNLLFQGYIVPGEPQNSAIYMKAVDGIMPEDQPQLSADELDAIRDWILALGDPNIDAGVIGTPGGGSSGGGEAPTYTMIYNNIIAPRCVNCHRVGGSRSNSPLDSYSGVLAQVNVSNPASSPLYAEVLNGSMPLGSSRLTATQVSQILTWIQAGALNN